MELQSRLEQRVSKDGKPYFCVVIKLTDELDKIVFLEPAELQCVKLTYSKRKSIKLSEKED